ncbi:MAG TPA: lipopolysaccharide heptosyltransferase I [Chlamydiales bacterium]|nr:lipopolysaccharide heptosyltransferase I [Chlamydiales bacterium]
MKRILLIKFTSLGDLIHALPAVTDASNAYPDLKIDWMIDENFAEVATWHRSVDQIFLTSHRTWAKKIFKSIQPISSLIRSVRKTTYDLVIDGQGNFKTALMALFMRGPTAGFDRKSVREWIASFAYQRTFAASKSAHAIDRLRTLFASSLGYPYPTIPPDFGIEKSRFFSSLLIPKPYIVFIHNASWDTKLWPKEHAKTLIHWITEKGYKVLLPWGNEKEKGRASELCVNQDAILLPKLTLSAIGSLLCEAKACISMDTGLSHLAAALNVPSITLYGSTHSGLIGTCGNEQFHLQSQIPCAPCNQKKCRFPGPSLNPPCLAALTPQQVVQSLVQILDKPILNICNK